MRPPRSWRTATAILALAAAAGCGAVGGGGPAPPRDGARSVGGGMEETEVRDLGCGADVADRAAGPPVRETGDLFTPQRGWGACTLLSHNGPPDWIESLPERQPPLINWWYGAAPGTGLVTLQRRGCPGGGCGPNQSPWRVVYVRW